MLHDARFFKAAAKIFRNVILDAHRREHNAEVALICAGDLRLTDDLHRQLIMLHTRTREDRELLTANQSRERIDARDTRVDVVSRIHARYGIDCGAVDVTAGLGIDGTQSVDRSARAVEDTSDDLGREGHFHRSACQDGGGVVERDVRGALKNLYHDALTLDLDDTSLSGAAVSELDGDDLLIRSALDAVEHD